MKKYIAAICAIFVLGLMTVTASAAEIPAYNEPPMLGEPIAAYTLTELDNLASEKGYVIVAANNGLLRRYEGRLADIQYIVTVSEDMVTKAAVQDNTEVGGALTCFQVFVQDGLLTTTADVNSFFEPVDMKPQLGSPVAAYTLAEIEAMALEAGYNAVDSEDENVIAQFIGKGVDVTYTITFTETEVTKATSTGAIVGYPIFVENDTVMVSELDPKSELFGDVISVDDFAELLVKNGYTVDQFAPVFHYVKGDSDMGASITIVGDELRIYNYGRAYGDLWSFFVADHSVSLAALECVF